MGHALTLDIAVRLDADGYMCLELSGDGWLVWCASRRLALYAWVLRLEAWTVPLHPDPAGCGRISWFYFSGPRAWQERLLHVAGKYYLRGPIPVSLSPVPLPQPLAEVA